MFKFFRKIKGGMYSFVLAIWILGKIPPIWTINDFS